MGWSYPPYPQPPVIYVAKIDTLKGISTYTVGLVLDILFSILSLIIGLSGLYIVSTVPTSGYYSEAYFFGAAVCGAFAILIIVFVISFIISLSSLFAMKGGATEFGPEHEQSVNRAFIYKWLGTCMSATAVGLTVFFLIAGYGSFTFGGPSPYAFLPLVVSVCWAAGVTFKAMTYQGMARQIAPPSERDRLRIGLIAVMLAGIGSIVVVGLGTVRALALFVEQNPEPASLALMGATASVFLAPGFSVIGYVLFLVAYRTTGKALREGAVRPQPYAARPPSISPYQAGSQQFAMSPQVYQDLNRGPPPP